MSIPDNSDAIPVDWHVLTKAAAIFAVLLVSVAFGTHAKLFLSLVVLIAGALWLAWGVWIIRQSRASKHWPTTQGNIVENSVGAIEAPLEHRLIYYHPVIAYRYAVNGIEYASNKIVLFPNDLRIPGGYPASFSDKMHRQHRHHVIAINESQKFCDQFPLSSTVTVHYNPHTPKDAVLITGALSRSHQHSIVFLVAGSFLLFIGLFLFYVEFWMR